MTTAAEPATMAELKRRLTRCLERHLAGSLTPDDLEEALSLAASIGRGRQDLLYMQLCNTHPGSEALGLTLVIGGVAQEPADPSRWPYNNVLDAINDGWRVISFPDLSLLLEATHTRTLGCEFILERWSAP